MPYLPTLFAAPVPEKKGPDSSQVPSKNLWYWFSGTPGASRTRGQDRPCGLRSQCVSRALAPSRGGPADKPLRQLLHALIAVVPRLGQNALHLGGQGRVAPEVAGGRLGARGVALVGAPEQRPRGSQGVDRPDRATGSGPAPRRHLR